MSELSTKVRVFFFNPRYRLTQPNMLVDEMRVGQKYWDSGAHHIARHIVANMLATVELCEEVSFVKACNALSNPERLLALRGKTLVIVDVRENEKKEFIQDWERPTGAPIEVRFFDLCLDREGALMVSPIVKEKADLTAADAEVFG